MAMEEVNQSDRFNMRPTAIGVEDDDNNWIIGAVLNGGRRGLTRHSKGCRCA